jgi:type VI secretion system protein VasG
VLPTISEQFLTRMLEGKTVKGIRVDVDNGQFTYGFD